MFISLLFQLTVKHKCKRLLTTVTLEQHDLDLSSFPFTITKQYTLIIILCLWPKALENNIVVIRGYILLGARFYTRY